VDGRVALAELRSDAPDLLDAIAAFAREVAG